MTFYYTLNKIQSQVSWPVKALHDWTSFYFNTFIFCLSSHHVLSFRHTGLFFTVLNKTTPFLFQSHYVYYSFHLMLFTNFSQGKFPRPQHESFPQQIFSHLLIRNNSFHPCILLLYLNSLFLLLTFTTCNTFTDVFFFV